MFFTNRVNRNGRNAGQNLFIPHVEMTGSQIPAAMVPVGAAPTAPTHAHESIAAHCCLPDAPDDKRRLMTVPTHQL